jgi:hypothetical protein
LHCIVADTTVHISSSKANHTQQNSRLTTNIGKAETYQQIIQIKLTWTKQCALHDTSSNKSSQYIYKKSPWIMEPFQVIWNHMSIFIIIIRHNESKIITRTYLSREQNIERKIIRHFYKMLTICNWWSFERFRDNKRKNLNCNRGWETIDIQREWDCESLR